LWLVRGGFRSTLFTAVEQHFHPTPLRYVEILDRIRYGEISADSCVAYLLHAMISNAMYATWFRAREARLRASCADLGIPLVATNQALVAYDVDPTPAGYAATLAKSVERRETPLHVLGKALTREHRIELALQIERLLEEESEEGERQEVGRSR
jgi:hypothetical protein